MGNGCAASRIFMSQTMVLNKMGEAIGMNGKYQPSKLRDRCAWPNPDYAHFEEALAIVQEKFVPLNRSHAALYPGDEVRQRFFVLEYAHVLGHLVVASHLESFKDFKLGKETLLCAIQDYDEKADSAIFIKTAGKQNWFHSGMFLYQVVFQWGDQHAAHVAQQMHKKSASAGPADHKKVYCMEGTPSRGE